MSKWHCRLGTDISGCCCSFLAFLRFVCSFQLIFSWFQARHDVTINETRHRLQLDTDHVSALVSSLPRCLCERRSKMLTPWLTDCEIAFHRFIVRRAHLNEWSPNLSVISAAFIALGKSCGRINLNFKERREQRNTWRVKFSQKTATTRAADRTSCGGTDKGWRNSAVPHKVQSFAQVDAVAIQSRLETNNLFTFTVPSMNF